MKKGKDTERRATDTVTGKMENEIDSFEGIASLEDVEETLPLDIYLDSRNSNPAI